MRSKRHEYAYSMNALYSTVGISKQSFHQYIARSELFLERLSSLRMEVDAIRREHGGCGLEKMYGMLSPDWIGRDRFIEVFQGLGYGVRRKRPGHRTTYPDHQSIYFNMIEGMLVWDVNQVWQTDITYYWLDGEHYYLTFIIDVYSRRIVGHAASSSLRVDANLKALKKAFSLRGSEELSQLIHHSDRGSQFTSKAYIALLLSKGITRISMCDSAQENAYGERIHGTIKGEYLQYWDIKSFSSLCRSLDRAVHNYNTKRSHNHLLKRMPPAKYEEWLSSNTQRRPRVIIYTEGLKKLKGASSPNKLYPTKDLQAPICPMVLD